MEQPKLREYIDENGLFRPSVRQRVYELLTHPGFVVFEAYINHIVENLKEEQIRRFANLETRNILNFHEVLAFKAGEVVGMTVAKNILALAYQNNKSIDDVLKELLEKTEVPPDREEIKRHHEDEE